MKKMIITGIAALFTLVSHASDPVRFIRAQLLPINCEETTTATVEVRVAGGQPDYTFEAFNAVTDELFGSSSGPSMEATFSGIDFASLRVVVTDSTGGTNTCTIDTIPSRATIVVWNISHPMCNGSEDGVIIIRARGLEPNTFTFRNCLTGETSEDGGFAGFGAGQACVSLITTDVSAQCSAEGPPEEIKLVITLTQPDALVLTASSTPATCGEINGTITVTSTTGGTPPYKYSLNGGEPQDSTEFMPLAAGSYTVAVIDNNMCSTEIGVEVGQVEDVVIDDIDLVNPTCFGLADGSITVFATPTDVQLRYTLNGGDEMITTGGSAEFTGLVAGTYLVRVSDLEDTCSDEREVMLTNPDQVKVKICKVCTTPARCPELDNGTITVFAKSKVPLQYALNDGPFQPSLRFKDLTPGKYKVLVTQQGDDTGACAVTCITKVCKAKKKERHC